jgi:hypothetical protein
MPPNRGHSPATRKDCGLIVVTLRGRARIVTSGIGLAFAADPVFAGHLSTKEERRKNEGRTKEEAQWATGDVPSAQDVFSLQLPGASVRRSELSEARRMVFRRRPIDRRFFGKMSLKMTYAVLLRQRRLVPPSWLEDDPLHAAR